jgi:multiple sugar transport system substrate-binding protein
MSANESTKITRRHFIKGAGYAIAGAATLSSGLIARAAAPAKLTVFNLPTFSQKVDKMLNDSLVEWAAKNNVKAEYTVMEFVQLQQQLGAAIQAKVPPDIVMLMEDTLHYYVRQGALIDVSDLVTDLAREGGGLMDTTKAIVTSNNKSYGVPLWNNPWPLYVRTDLLKKANAKVPTNWDEILKVSLAVQHPPDLYGYGMTLGSAADTALNYAPILWSFNGSFFTKDAKTSLLNTKANIEALKVVKSWWDKGIIPPGSLGWDAGGNNKIYQSGQACFICNPPSVYAALVSSDPELAKNTLLAPMPYFTPIDGWQWAIPKDSKNIDLAKKCLREWMKPAAIETFIEQDTYRCPPYRGLYEKPYWQQSDLLKQFKKFLDTGRLQSWPSPPTPATGEMINSNVVPNMLAAMIVDKRTPEEAAERGHKQLQEILGKYK